MYFDNMVLYYKPTCPFCHKVAYRILEIEAKQANK